MMHPVDWLQEQVATIGNEEGRGGGRGQIKQWEALSFPQVTKTYLYGCTCVVLHAEEVSDLVCHGA